MQDGLGLACEQRECCGAAELVSVQVDTNRALAGGNKLRDVGDEPGGESPCREHSTAQHSIAVRYGMAHHGDTSLQAAQTTMGSSSCPCCRVDVPLQGMLGACSTMPVPLLTRTV